MVGLSVVLESTPTQNCTVTSAINHLSPQVISKSMFMTINKQPSSSSSSPTSRKGQRRHLPPPPDFLHQCFLCKQKLLPGNDIYMYKGDRGFCSVECRCRQIFMDEEESFRAERNCSLTNFDSRRGSAGNRKRAAGRFVY